MKNPVKTRREFIKKSASAAAAGLLYLNFGDKAFGSSEKKSRVVLIRDENVLDKLNKPHADIVQNMLDEATTALFDVDNPTKAWQQIIKPEDVVGIKTNVWRYLSTTSAVENAIQKRLLEAGVDSQNISINDRGVRSDPIF